MRLTIVALAVCAVVLLGGCAAIPVKIASDQKSQEQDAATKSDLADAKIAVIASTIGDPGTTPELDQLADYGFTPGSTTPDIALHFSDTDNFCIDGTSVAGTAYKVTQPGSPTAGVCEEGTDY